MMLLMRLLDLLASKITKYTSKENEDLTFVDGHEGA
jgi:hypothetical protein